MGMRIETLFAWVMTDEDGDEVLPAMHATGGADVWIPFTGANERRIRSLRPFALAVAKERGTRVRLLRFTSREELDVIEPGQSRTKH